MTPFLQCAKCELPCHYAGTEMIVASEDCAMGHIDDDKYHAILRRSIKVCNYERGKFETYVSLESYGLIGGEQ